MFEDLWQTGILDTTRYQIRTGHDELMWKGTCLAQILVYLELPFFLGTSADERFRYLLTCGFLASKVTLLVTNNLLTSL